MPATMKPATMYPATYMWMSSCHMFPLSSASQGLGLTTRPSAEPVPAVDVDRDEDRLDEERDALQPERDPEDLAERGHEVRPQQPDLEGEDRPGHHADGEDQQRDLRPALGERLVREVASAQVEALDE